MRNCFSQFICMFSPRFPTCHKKNRLKYVSIAICIQCNPSIDSLCLLSRRGALLPGAAAGGRRGGRGGGRVALQPQVEEVAPPQPPQHGQQQGQPGAGAGTSAGGARLPRPAVRGGHRQQLPDRGRRRGEGPEDRLELGFVRWVFWTVLGLFFVPTPDV